MNKPVDRNHQAEAAAAPSLPLAILWMSGAVLSFLLLAISGRELSDTMTISI